MSLTFKQYNQYLETPLDEELLTEWPWSNPAEKEKARLEKLRLLAKRGDLQAKKELDDIEHAAKVTKLRTDRERTHKDATWKQAQAETEHKERGASRSYDAETGSVARLRQARIHDQIWGHEPKTR